MKRVVYKVLRSSFERSGGKFSLQELSTQLEESTDVIAKRMRNAQDTEKNLELIKHIAGIEAWGTRRLRVFLGEPPLSDEYDGYRPDEETKEALIAAFLTIRENTLNTVREISENNSSESLKVEHNDFGAMTLKAWIAYIKGHAFIETRKMK